MSMGIVLHYKKIIAFVGKIFSACARVIRPPPRYEARSGKRARACRGDDPETQEPSCGFPASNRKSDRKGNPNASDRLRLLPTSPVPVGGGDVGPRGGPGAAGVLPPARHLDERKPCGLRRRGGPASRVRDVPQGDLILALAQRGPRPT